MPSPSSVYTKRQRIAELARKAPDMAFTSLSQHIDIAWLREAYHLTHKDAAPGIDGVTAQGYRAKLEENLQGLLDRAKSGRYVAPSVRRVHIPKGTGSETRPIGIPTFEDKVLQRAIAMVLESVYEVDFLDVSYGFRPGRSAHKALEVLREQLMEMRGGWVVEVDIRKFFDNLDHGHLRAILGQRVRDGVVGRLIGKWLNAGVLESGQVFYPDTGTPQGGVISPLLANIYLHEVLDKWFEGTVKPVLRGRAFLVRYADDFVMGFEREDDARRVLAVLAKRFGKYGLTLHPEKTRMVPFRRQAKKGANGTSPRVGEEPGTFDFLGFTHYWGYSRHGNSVVKRRTARDRLVRAVRRIKEFCRQAMHWEIEAQHKALVQKVHGHYAYYGITANMPMLQRFQYAVMKVWFRWLRRRDQRRTMSWELFLWVLKAYPLPPPRIVHSAIPRAANP